MDAPSLFLLLFGTASLAVCLIFTDLSEREQEQRAARIARSSGVISLVLASCGALVGGMGARLFLGIYLILFAVILFLLFVPIRAKPETPQHRSNRYDEREIMFARMRLQPGSENYQQYYQEHHAHKALDDTIRANGWQSRDSLPSQLMDIAADASFTAVGALRGHVDGPVAEEKKEIPADRRNTFIIGLAKHFGALDVGIVELKPEHVYSHIGRGAGEWGAAVELNHTHAIAFTVEMRWEQIVTAPRQPNMAESAVQYAHAGLTAVMLASTLRGMGYEARAHIDGNYRVICPLVARDAGLGEIGRHGLLITPDQGPRVRLAVVTTNLPLEGHHYEPDAALIDFCERCTRCADHCPAKALPLDGRKLIDGALRWQIDQAQCYHYWTKVGTDCGRCMAVCPLARSGHWIHRLVRKAITRSALFRRVYIPFERWLYGDKLKPKDPPPWLDG
ncbi:MAG: 4Fe-4S dicluster domain-containing protein [Anaerolineae bacterium]|jgi:ferredoxin|nr:4Fe-4S dicluster domain-containing protein [Anaerolineae bacterium]